MKLILLILLLSICKCTIAATDPDVAKYDIPADAIKIGPLPTRDAREKLWAYVPADTKMDPIKGPERGSVIAYETFFQGVLVKKQLLKNDVEHGIQREWYSDGHIKSESPYKNGIMDGTYKIWNDKQELISQYEMINGAGIRHVYFDNGRLQEKRELKENQGNGELAVLYDNGQIAYMGHFKADESIGLWFGFNKDGSLSYLAWGGAVFIEFTPAGAPLTKLWKLHDEAVEEKIYAKAAAENPNLFPYYANVNEYKKFVTPEVKALVEKYRALPPVKIPLEFDAQGNPVLAPAVAGAKR